MMILMLWLPIVGSAIGSFMANYRKRAPAQDNDETLGNYYNNSIPNPESRNPDAALGNYYGSEVECNCDTFIV